MKCPIFGTFFNVGLLGFESNTSATASASVKGNNKATGTKSDSSVAFYNRGNARSDVDNTEGALADYVEAIRLNPGKAIRESRAQRLLLYNFRATSRLSELEAERGDQT